MPIKKWGALLALTAGLALMSSPAQADVINDPVDLEGAYVVDLNSSIPGQESQVAAAIDDLYDSSKIQLFVVYVNGFSSPTDPVAWANETASINGLGDNDVLLAVATFDRQYALSVADNFSLSDDQLDRVETAIESQLRDNKWADAAIVGAETLASEAKGVTFPVLGYRRGSPPERAEVPRHTYPVDYVYL